MFPLSMALGKRSMIASTGGARTVLGPESSPPCSTSWMMRGGLAENCGASMLRSFEPVVRLRGPEKQPAQPCALGGNKATQLKEPEDHALGRSRGGFGTKVHLICDRHGIVLAVFVTPGQQHESTAFETVMGRVALTPRKGRCRWPKRLAGDKGYSYPRIRLWCRQRRIQAVIPTRSDQPRTEKFDKVTYRQRNIIERVVNWYK